MARVAIIGVGAIGGVVSGLLETTGLHEITLCTRRPLDKLMVETPDGTISMSARNLIDPAQADAVDWVLVATKTYDVGSTSEWLRRLCGEDTRLAAIQNGVEHRDNFKPYVNPANVLPVIIDCPAERTTQGMVRQRGAVQMQIENGALGSSFADLFHGAKVKVNLTDDFLTAAWKKLCLNSAGAISALVMKPAGIFRDEAISQIALEIIAECAAVGTAEGARIPDDIGVRIVEGYRRQPVDSINSILADRIAGRPMEIDSRNGVIVRKGKKHGIATPVNRWIVALLNVSAWP
ncbi:MAG TPA: 2-dehydropantoate 2-reductase [Nitrospira sp.]|nr:2-dehydropantoate 2-reductase [Nitrospira sp.]